jgi:hypothetical protein
MARTFGWLFGGICCGTGILNLLFAFQPSTKADYNQSLDHIGWDGLSQVTTTGHFPVAVACIGLGILTLVGLNAGAWRQTGGY